MNSLQGKAIQKPPPAEPLSHGGMQAFHCVNLRPNERRTPRHRVMAQKPQQRNPQHACPADENGQSVATNRVFFLRTKLLPPRPAQKLLPRPRLAEPLQTNLAHPIPLVTANAGSGKTTFV